MNRKNLLSAVLAVFLATALAGCAGSQTNESAGEYIDDTTITTKVKSQLIASENVSGTAISVETFKGTVQLSGFVNSDSEKREAERIASGIKGVRRVENRITVKGS